MQRFPANKCEACNNNGVSHCAFPEECNEIKEAVLIDDVINMIKSKKVLAEHHLTRDIPATLKIHIEGKIIAFEQILKEL